MKITISTGKSVYKPGIIQHTITVDQLYDKLSSPDIRRNKDGPYFVFASFKNKQRTAASVKQYYGATLDLDDVTLTLKEIQKTFKRINFCIHTTHSHKAPNKGNRYRIVIPYKYPISPEKHREVATYLLYRLGTENIGSDVVSQKALSRPTYLPATTKDRKKYFKCVVNNKPRFFDPADAELSPEERFELDEQNDTSEKEKFDINEEYTEGGRNDAIARLIGKFIHTGMDLQMVIQSAKVWNHNNCSPPLKDSEVETITKSIFQSHKRNSKDSGWGFDELIRRVNNSNNPEKDYDTYMDLVAGSAKKLSKSEKERLIRKIADKTKIPLPIVRDELKAKVETKEEQTLSDDTEKEEVSISGLKQEFKHWVYLRRDDKMFNSKNGIVYPNEGFNRAFLSKLDKGALLPLLLRYHAVKQADMMMFNPEEEITFRQDHITYVNTYIPPEIFPIPGSVHPMLKHFRYLIGNKEERNIILDYIAFLIQNPGVKIRWMPVIKGSKGIGKSMIVDLVITPLLGMQNVKPVSSKLISSDFNAWQLDTQLVVFHELKIGETRKEKKILTDSIKEFITDPTFQAHRKGIDPYTVLNKANVFGLTNHEDSLMITQDERRFMMIRSEAFPKPISYYLDLVKWFGKNKQEMLHFFDTRDISKFNAVTAPETGFTKEIKESSYGWPMNILMEALNDEDHYFNIHGYCSYNGIVRYVQSKSTGKDALIAQNLENHNSSQTYILLNTMKEVGFRKWSHISVKSDNRLSISGTTERVWVSPSFSKRKSPEVKTIKALIHKHEKKVYDFDGV